MCSNWPSNTNGRNVANLGINSLEFLKVFLDYVILSHNDLPGFLPHYLNHGRRLYVYMLGASSGNRIMVPNLFLGNKLMGSKKYDR